MKNAGALSTVLDNINFETSELNVSPEYVHADVSMPSALAAFFLINYRKQNDDWRKTIKTWAKYMQRVHIYICIYML